MWISILATVIKILLSFPCADISEYCGNALKTGHDNFFSMIST